MLEESLDKIAPYKVVFAEHNLFESGEEVIWERIQLKKRKYYL